jgi:subtilisin family serine protease
MSLRPLIIILLFLFQRASAQEFKFLVQFRDKNNNGFSIQDPSVYLSEKSIQRRLKQHIPIETTDLPLTAAYVDSLAALPSLRILNKSRWFNQVFISIPDSSVLQQIRQFSFVLSTEPVNNSRSKKITGHVSINQHTGFSARTETTTSVSSLSKEENYGASFSQVHIHNGEYLHDQGFHGEGMTIAILDNGFNNYLFNPAFDSIRNDHRILGTYDFVNQKASVNEEEVHGAYCFSIIASNIPGILIGTAPAASYWLFKTEDDFSETPVEEQNWVAAAEFADSAGVDLITTSLGYSYFDDSVYNLNYPERNGHYSLVSRAANLAVARGIIVTASAGNSGGQTEEKNFVLCPSDGDSVYAVGAVDSRGQIAFFSSWGPNGSGQIKPDGVSFGSGTFFIGPDGNLTSGSGTSYANPNLAGLITCLWQAFPEFNAHDILSAVRQSSDLYIHPDDHYGYGLPDFEKAWQILFQKRYAILNPLTDKEWIHVFPVPFHESIQIFFQPPLTGTAVIQLLDISGKLLETQSVYTIAGQQQLLKFKTQPSLTSGMYFIRYSDQKKSKTVKTLKY